MSRFVNERKNNWQRLEDLLNLSSSATLRGLSKAEVREFGELYRRAATDLAIARAETRDLKLINYLNSLVIRAHGKIYRADSKGVNIIRQFLTRDFPQAFRETKKYTLISFLLFAVFCVAGGLLCYFDTNFTDSLGISTIRYSALANDRWWLSLNEANQIGSTMILANNILVAFKAFAYGAFFGIGTVYILIFNGLLIGGVLGTCYQANPAFGNELATFMFAHGVIELSCIFIAGGAGLLIGYSMINPGDLTRIEALKKAGLTAIRLAVGCALWLFVAGVIEGFVSPSNLLPIGKVAVGILSGVLLYSYLFFVGRNNTESENLATSKDVSAVRA